VTEFRHCVCLHFTACRVLSGSGHRPTAASWLKFVQEGSGHAIGRAHAFLLLEQGEECSHVLPEPAAMRFAVMQCSDKWSVFDLHETPGYKIAHDPSPMIKLVPVCNLVSTSILVLPSAQTDSDLLVVPVSAKRL
jgi:hypothetical protein